MVLDNDVFGPFNPSYLRYGVPQTSESAVSRVSKPAGVGLGKTLPATSWDAVAVGIVTSGRAVME